MLQTLLQSFTNLNIIIEKCDKNLLRSVTGIARCDRRLLQSVINIRKWDVTRDTGGKDKIEKLLDKHEEKIVSEGKETIEMMQG